MHIVQRVRVIGFKIMYVFWSFKRKISWIGKSTFKYLLRVNFANGTIFVRFMKYSPFNKLLCNSRGKFFANFTNQIKFVKMLPLHCLLFQ